MSENKWWSIKVGAELLSDFIVSILSYDTLLDFQESIQVVPPKHLMYFLAGIKTK